MYLAQQHARQNMIYVSVKLEAQKTSKDLQTYR